MRHGRRALVWSGLLLALLLLATGTSVAAEPRILFSSNRDGNDEIYTVNPDGSGIARITDDPGQDAAPVWSPDGTKIAFASNRDGDFEIYVADFDGANVQQLTENEVVDFAPAFSPDGTQIAFSTDRVGNRDIFVMNADGSDPQPVTEGTGFEEEPAWSPDGTKIAFWRSVDVFTVNPDGSGLTNLTAEFEPVSVRPAWSPDGARIAFETTTDGIWTMSADGADHQQVTTDGAAPDWSPDGTQLVYWGSNPPPEGPSDLLIVSADGGEPVAVTNDAAIERDPDWHIAETGGGGGGEDPSFVVTNTNDSGAGSLRQAILDANTTEGHDTITFAIDGGGVHTIAPTSPLPPLSDEVTIDGYSQPGAKEGSVAVGAEPDAVLLIELSGDELAGGAALELATSNSTIQGLVINGSFSPGVRISGASQSNVVRGNYIGTDPTGMESGGLDGWGIDIGDTAEDNEVGGPAVADRNVISGNGVESGGGVRITGSTSSNRIVGNVIGLSANGRLEIGNFVGVEVSGGIDNEVGGAFPSNFIAGNADHGVDISSDGNAVLGNFIGFSWVGDPVVHVGNGGHGVRVNARDTVVADNIIANNAGDGVSVPNAEAIRVTIRNTKTRMNGGLGIDLGDDGVTPNDEGDGDGGPNFLQNFPVIDDVTIGDGNVTIGGVLSSAASTEYTLEFFRSSVSDVNADGCDPSDFGEGASSLGTATVTTNAAGDGPFSVTLSQVVSAGDFITATARTFDGTSEYSECFEVDAGSGTSFVVTNTNNSGPGSLRQAILDANTTEGTQTISFSIGSGLQTIAPTAPLPVITDPVVIDGTTQPGYTGTPASLGPPVIEITGTEVLEPGSDYGLDIDAGSSTIRALTINGWRAGNVRLRGSGGNRVEASYIGTDSTGSHRVSATSAGIWIHSSDNVIGGSTGPVRNVIAGNGVSGEIHIRSRNASGATIGNATGNVVAGNYIGTNAFGTAALVPPTEAAERILITGDASGNVVGGDLEAERNVIAGGFVGVRIHGGTENEVRGNFIGTDASGSNAVPNGTGVAIDLLAYPDESTTSSDDNVVIGNLVAFNGGDGVRVTGGTRNRIEENAIHTNGTLGIDLGADGVTPNDGEDTDLGPNDLQNFPELETVSFGAGSTDHVNIEASLSVGPGGTYRIDYYASFACDGSGNGEGERHLGHDFADAVGPNVSFASTNVGPVGAKESITATVTSPDGSTSEFSECHAVGEDLGELAFTDPSECVPGFLGGHTIDFEDAPEDGALAMYGELGITFVATGANVPRAIRAPEFPTSSPTTRLVNVPVAIEGPGSSSEIPLRMTFAEPQTAVGFFLGNGGDVLATVTALNGGDTVGSVQVAVPTDAVETYVGIKLLEGTFDELRVDYGGAAQPEELDDLCFTTSEAEGEESDALTLTSDQKSVPAGVMNVPLSVVPSNQLPSFAGSPSSAPVGSIPVGSIPVGSIPVGSIGLSAVPVGSIGLDQILLSQLPVNADTLLAGTALVDRPRQSITLADVYANATTRERFNALNLPESGLMQSILNGVPFSAFLLGRATLSQLPAPGGSTWCAAITAAGGSCTGVSGSNTVVGLSIAGIPVGSIPVGSIPVGSIPVGSIPVGSIPVGSIDLVASRLAGIPVGSIPEGTRGDVVELPFTGTLGEAKAAGRIKPGAQLRHLVGAFPAGLVLNDLIMGIVPRSALAWEGFPIDGFQLFAGTGDVVRYRLAFTLSCPVPSNFSARVRLPEGWLYKPGTTRWRYGTGTPAAGAEPSTTSRSGARWAELPGTPCPAGVSSRPVELSLDALSGLSLGVEDATGSVTMGGTTLSTGNDAPVLVTQNWETNDGLDDARTIGPNRLIVGHVAKAGDVEVFRVPIPEERGTKTTILLSHIAEGADFDLVVHKPAAPSLQSSPVGSIPVGSIPVEDGGSSVDNRSDALPPETLQDIPVGSIPVGSIPVGSISANRGNADEAALVVADGEEGFYTIAVSGYNGSHSDRPFVLRVVQTPPPSLPPCPARGLTLGAPGTLPAPAAGIKTLFVVNRQRMAALHGAQATADMLAAASSVAARPEVAGQILEVDGDAAVRAAYAAWDAAPCSIDAVNHVVAAINAVVARSRAVSTVENVVLLGSDDALPMMRRLDPVTISNETDEAPDLLFTLRNGNANALYAAAALGYFLSDTVYGAFTSVPWLGRDLYLPNVAVGRLVETATEIERQLLLYVSKDGLLDPQSTLTTAYDFLTDGGQAVATGLAGVGAANEAIINETWTKSTLTPKLTAPADVLSVNAHYSHWLLQPAAGTALVSTGDLPDVEDAFAERILFTMGCHGGLNVPDSLLGASPSAFQQERMLDWTQSYARANAAVYVANTGFGYGDTVANALSERLMSIFADELSDGGTIGERWLDSVHSYFGTAGVYGVYDEKALTEATFYGLPFWSLGAETPDSPPATGTPPIDPASGLPVASIARVIAATEHTTARGRFWDAQGDTLAIHYRPLQPRVAIDVTRAGLVATGVIVKSLQTQDVGGVDPVHHTPTIDLAANEPERRFRELIFPANAVSLTRSRSVPGGERQHAVVIAGQYRPGSLPNNGTERLITQIGLEVAYVPAVTDETPPVIQEVSVVNTSSATIFVRAAESAAGGVRRVAALYAAAGSAGTWSFVELSFNAARGGWEATVPTSGDVQVIAMAQNVNGLVAYSANKGQNHPSVTDTAGPDILLESPGPGSVFLLNQQVRPSFSCSDPGVVVSCTGSPLVNGLLDTSQPGERTFTITARDLSGRESTLEVTYFVRYVFEGFFAPVENPPTLNTGQAGRTYPVKWQLKDANGVLVKTLSAVRSIAKVPLASCADRPQETVEPGDELSSSSLKFDGGQYVYNWKTERADAGCRRLVVEFADGTRRSADFLLR